MRGSVVVFSERERIWWYRSKFYASNDQCNQSKCMMILSSYNMLLFFDECNEWYENVNISQLTSRVYYGASSIHCCGGTIFNLLFLVMWLSDIPSFSFSSRIHRRHDLFFFLTFCNHGRFQNVASWRNIRFYSMMFAERIKYDAKTIENFWQEKEREKRNKAWWLNGGLL